MVPVSSLTLSTNTSNSTCSSSNLDSFGAQEVGRSVQHVSSVRGVVVRVGGMVAGLDELQPRAQRGLRAVQELANAEGRKDLQAKVGQRPVEDCVEQLLL